MRGEGREQGDARKGMPRPPGGVAGASPAERGAPLAGCASIVGVGVLRRDQAPGGVRGADEQRLMKRREVFESYGGLNAFVLANSEIVKASVCFSAAPRAPALADARFLAVRAFSEEYGGDRSWRARWAAHLGRQGATTG